LENIHDRRVSPRSPSITRCLELIHQETGLAEKVDRLSTTLAEGGWSSRGTSCIAATSSSRYRGQLAQLMKYRLVDMTTGRPLKVVDHVGCHYNKIFPASPWRDAEYCDVPDAMIPRVGWDEVDYPERPALAAEWGSGNA